MSDSLTYVDKCMIAALATMNASYLSREGNEISVSNAAVETMKIKTLAEYYSADPEKLETYNPEKMDSNELMRTYVVPLVLDNNERIDLVINKKGQDMACVYLDEDSKEHQFALTPRMQGEIERALKVNGISGLETKIDFDNIKKMMEPRTLEEFSEAVEKDNLVPKSPRDTVTRIKSKDPSADIKVKDDDAVFEVEDKENKTQEEIQEEISLEEERLKQIAEEAGMTLDDIKRFCKDNKLTSKSIKGAREVLDVDSLEEKLDGRQLGSGGSKSVVIIRTEENNMQSRARVVGKDGKTLLDDSNYDDKMVELVPERDASEPIRDLDEHEEEIEQEEEIEYVDTDGTRKTSYVEGNKGDVAAFQERFNALKEEYKQKLAEINSSDTLSATDKSQAREDLACDFYASVCSLERDTGVQAEQISKEALADAEQAVEDDAKTKVATAVVNTLEAVGDVALGATAATVGIAGVIAGTGAKLINDNRRKQTDVQEDDGYGDTIGHYGIDLNNPLEKRR